MKLEDLSHENQLDLINQVVKSYFEKRINVAELSESKARSMLESVQQTILAVRNSSNIHTSEQNPEYLRAIMLEQALVARLSEDSVGTVGSVGTISPTTASGNIATTPPPKTTDIQRRAAQMKDPKMKDMLNKAAKGQNMSQEEVKRLAAFAADSQLEETDDAMPPATPGNKFSVSRLWARITDYEKRAKATSSPIKKQHYLNMATELRGQLPTSTNESGAKQFNEEQSVYKIQYNKEDDLYDIVDELGEVVSSHGDRPEAQAELRKLKTAGSNSSRKVSGTYGKVDENKLRKTSTAKLVEFYRNHRSTGHNSVKLVEAELLRRKSIQEAKKDKDPIEVEYDRLKKLPIAELRSMIKSQQKVVDTSEFRTKDHAVSAILRNKYGNKKVAAAFGLKEGRTRRLVTESEVQQAQVVLAAQDMVDQIQKMIEQASSTQFKDLPALVSQIRLDQGPDQSTQFNQAVTAALSTLLQSLQTAKDQMLSAVDVATGKAEAGPVIDPGDDEAAALDSEADADADAELNLDSETSDITGFGRERR